MHSIKSVTLCLIVFGLLAMGHTTVSAADSPASATAEKEILRLIEAVSQSQCLFERNGQKYLGADAANHLHRKWDNAKSKIDSAESFIEQIASKSSASGKLYMIHCTNKEAETSHQWLLRELAHLRTHAN